MNPKTTTTAVPKTTTTAVTEVKLAPALRTKVLAQLRAYEQLSAQRKVLDLAMQKNKDAVQALFEKAGEFTALVQGVALDGFKAKWVTGTRKQLSKELLIRMGLTEDMLAEATVEKPNRPYLKISPPGSNGEDES